MLELDFSDLDTVVGGSISYPAVYVEERSGNMVSIPGVSTTSTGLRHYDCQHRRIARP